MKEFEDERIRKRLIFDFQALRKTEWGGLKVKDILVWLEKQGEQKPVEWNEEDEKMLHSIISDFAGGHKSSIGQDKWLKSLKERLGGEK